MLFKFPKSERLSNKKKFEALFKLGYHVNAYPLKLIYIVEEINPESPSLQFAFTVPKRTFKKATSRNLLKRRIKESFRLEKFQIYHSIELHGKAIFGIIIYIEKEIQDYHTIHSAMIKLIDKLNNKVALKD